MCEKLQGECPPPPSGLNSVEYKCEQGFGIGKFGGEMLNSAPKESRYEARLDVESDPRFSLRSGRKRRSTLSCISKDAVYGKAVRFWQTCAHLVTAAAELFT